MLIRNDLVGNLLAPDSARTYLLRKGGTNLYGEANFRLVWSPDRLRWKGGKFEEWPDYVPVNERGGITQTAAGVIIPNHHRMLSSTIEVRQVRAYAFDAGWLLERWIPPAYYGSKGDWMARCVPGTTVPFGGPFPIHGDYEMCHNSASIEVPSISQLQNAIDRCERAREQHVGDVSSAVRERINRAIFEYEQQMSKEAEENRKFFDDVMDTIYSNSLGMGAYRTQLALQAGITEHVGN